MAVHKAFLCVSIALNAVCAGGMFTFPLLSPVLASHCKLTQPQLTTIVLAGMMSQYTVASLVGATIDRHGPSLCSLIAAGLFSSSFGGFAFEVYNTPDDLNVYKPAMFYRFTFYFFLAGLGTVFSYYSSIFAASKAFPNNAGLANGTSMALFGLSPLFFSVTASALFQDSSTSTIHVAPFMTFLASVTGIVYLLGFFSLKEVPQVLDAAQAPTSPDEETSLLATYRPQPNLSVYGLLQQSDFWLLGLFCLLVLGVCEMVISNIGTITVSLPISGSSSGHVAADSTAALQVKIISAANTVGRIVAGPLADFVSPIASYLPHGGHTFQRKHRISRFAFLSGSAFLLVLTFLWMVFAVNDQRHLWVLSLGIGLSYSAVFSVLPSLVSSLWGMQSMGRNFGVMMYAPFCGTPLFSYLYAFVTAMHTNNKPDICKGRPCWEFTFAVAVVTSCGSFFCSLLLWKRWKGRI